MHKSIREYCWVQVKNCLHSKSLKVTTIGAKWRLKCPIKRAIVSSAVFSSKLKQNIIVRIEV